MVIFTAMPSASSVFSAYASVSGSIMLFQTMVNQVLPRQLQAYIASAIRYYFKPRSSIMNVIIEESDGISNNQIYNAAEIYLYTKIDSNIECIKVTKRPKEPNINIKFSHCEKVVDLYEGIEIHWKFSCEERKRGSSKLADEDTGHVFADPERRFFELSFNRIHKDKVLNSYIPFILQKAKDIKSQKKVVKLHTLSSMSYSTSVVWESINLEHPCTFDTLAMDTNLKKSIIDDLDRFVKRKNFYRKVGKAWKRGYLLHGPPGTGKSSLIAAMANYLKFDVYDLELASIRRDSDLRRLLLRLQIDQLSSLKILIAALSCLIEWGLLHMEMGVTANNSCGDERIIIFTTNNKEKLDPALLRPGRMDVHIYMSYLTTNGFKLLAENYLNLDEHHIRFLEIQGLIESMKVSPAEVAEELMKNDDAEVSLGGLVNYLQRKKIDDEIKDKEADEVELHKGKKLKLDISNGDFLERSYICITNSGQKARLL